MANIGTPPRPPTNTPSLECTAADPQAPHRPVNHGVAPQHFYRIEFKRIDDDVPAPRGPHRSRAGERKLYEDGVVRLFDVTLLPGHPGAVSRSPTPAILAFDTKRAFDAADAVVGAGAGRSAPPDGLAMPRCMTIDAGTALPSHAPAGAPTHYYRLEFKRVEGNDLKDRWREWYPWMTQMR